MNIKYKIMFGLIALLLTSSLAVQGKAITITAIEDANVSGVKIGVQSGTTSDSYGQDNLPNAEIVAYDSVPLAIAGMGVGDVHLVMGDKPVLALVSDADTTLDILASFSEELFGMGVKEGETTLLAALNAAITEILVAEMAVLFALHFPGEISALYDETGGATFEYPAAAAGDLADIISSGIMEIGYDPTYAPFESLDENEQPIGFTIDLMEAVVAKLNTEYSSSVTLQWESSEWDPVIIANLQNDEFHVIASSMTINPTRDEQIDFTRAYYASIQGLLGPTGGEIDIPDDDDSFLPLPILPMLFSLSIAAIVVRRLKR